MYEPNHSTQEAFLTALTAQKAQITLFLTNGVKLQGTILASDDFTILLSRSEQVQLVYKHSLATIVPASAVKLSTH